MKKISVVMMAVMAISVLLAVPAFSAPKLIVKAANGTDDVFHVEDTGNVGIFSGITNPAAPTAPLNIVSAGSGNLFTITTTSPAGGAGFEFKVPGGGDWLWCFFARKARVARQYSSAALLDRFTRQAGLHTATINETGFSCSIRAERRARSA